MSEFAIHEPRGLDELSVFADALLMAAGRSGSLLARPIGLLVRAEVNLLAGENLDAVRAELHQSRALHVGAGAESGRALAIERLAQTEARAGNAEMAQQLHEQALALGQTSAVAGHLLLLVFGGMLENVPVTEGVRVLERAQDELAGLNACKPCSMSFHLGVATVQADRGILEDSSPPPRYGKGHQRHVARRSVARGRGRGVGSRTTSRRRLPR